MKPGIDTFENTSLADRRRSYGVDYDRFADDGDDDGLRRGTLAELFLASDDADADAGGETEEDGEDAGDE